MVSKSEWDQERMRQFWWFMAERHEIFRRRMLFQQLPPWTRDPILATVRFTNVYRELDRVTRYVIQRIVSRRASKRDVFWNVLVFRFFNWIPTYEALGGFQPPGAWQPRRVVKTLVARQRQGLQVFTGAYMVQAIGSRPGVGGKVELIVHRRLEWVRHRLDSFFKILKAQPTMDAAHEVLCQIPGIAAFNAYELVTDLCYHQAVLPFSEDDWVNPGPGALKGLRALGPRIHWTDDLAREAIGQLCQAQAQGFHEAGATLNGPPLTLRNIEHSLCEYSKYVRAAEGGHAKRRFHAKEADMDLTPWEHLPSRFADPKQFLRCQDA